MKISEENILPQNAQAVVFDIIYRVSTGQESPSNRCSFSLIVMKLNKQIHKIFCKKSGKKAGYWSGKSVDVKEFYF